MLQNMRFEWPRRPNSLILDLLRHYNYPCAPLAKELEIELNRGTLTLE